MDITRHALERVAERTKMCFQDVLWIIESQAAVFLGEKPRRKYFCFHSLQDRCCKVAVVDSEEKELITVLHESDALPKGVKRPNFVTFHQAKRLLNDLLSKSTQNHARRCDAVIRVLQKRGSRKDDIVYQSEAISVAVSECKELKRLIPAVDAELRKIFSAVAEAVTRTSSVYYEIIVKDPLGSRPKIFLMKHDEFRKQYTS